jgi:hypothetical protein
MRHTAVVRVIILASLAGCSAVQPRPSAPAQAPASAEPSRGNPSPTGSDSGSRSTESNPGAREPSAVVESVPATVPSRSDSNRTSRPAAERGVVPAGPAAVAPARTTASTTATVARPPAAAKVVPASSVPVKPPDPPPLDLTALEQRLRDTRAVGLFTKLSLKNQVDDLLGQFRSYYRGSKPPPPPDLRQRYDGLLLKVLSVLQDGDPPLAAQIWSSREAIWIVLADPQRLEKI